MNSPLVGIIDYGMGNIRSVANAVDKLGGREILVSNSDDILKCDKLILPGVGAFQQAIYVLNELGIKSVLNEFRNTGKSILGICLGMQLFCETSKEEGSHAGLGWFKASVQPFSKSMGLRVPHMGWNNVVFKRDDPILKGVESDSDFYFVHSYHVECDDSDDVLGESNYGVNFASIIKNENVYGIQFHPEKSQAVGLQIMKNFIED